MARPERLKAIRKHLRDIDGLLVTDITNVRYLTGFTGSSGFALVTRSESIFCTDFRYVEQAGEEVHDHWNIVEQKDGQTKTIKDLSRKTGIRRLGFESSVSYEFYQTLRSAVPEVKALGGVVEKHRAVKDPVEIGLIKEAVRRAEAAFKEIKPYIRAGVKERSLAMRLAERLGRRGCRRIPFDIIVASGGNSAMPHARATDKRLEPGDLVTIDWGGEAGGYFSDMTRTLLLKGPGMGRKKEIYGLVLRANREGVAAVTDGAGSRHVDNRARDVIKNAGYGRHFGHALGHGVGLEVHELPRIGRSRAVRIREGMVFTIEPGIYVPGLGGVRIEDMVAVAGGGARLLTRLPRRLEIIS
jgi:Xaa-Pro aminopeptidase